MAQNDTVKTADKKQRRSSMSVRTESEPLTVVPKEKMDVNEAIFERMILIIPYKAPETVKQIKNSFEMINM